MAVQSTPYVETALSHTSELFRRNLQAGLPIGSAGGVVPATPASSANLTAGLAGCSDLQVTAPVSGMSVNISAGQIIVPGNLGSGSGYGIGKGYGYPTVTLNGGSSPNIASNANATVVTLTTQGAYYCYNDDSSGAVNLAIASSDPSNPRIDVVGAQVEDAAYSGSNNDWKLAVVTGTAAASPTIPTFPNNFVPLALVWVPAASTSIVSADILDLRVAFNRNPFRARMYRSGSFTTTASSFVVLPCDTIVTDITGSCTTGSSAEFTCPIAGVWLANTQAELASSSARAAMGLFRNGTQYAQPSDDTAATAVAGGGGSRFIECNNTDTIQSKIFTSANTALTVGATYSNYLDVVLVSTV